MAENTPEKKEKWTTYLALTTVLIAVCATLSTFKGGGFSTRALMNQTKASNQWSYFQSKSIKSYMYELRKEELETELKNLKDALYEYDIKKEYQDKIEDYQKKISKYDEEKAQISKDAKNFEKESDDAKIHSESFGIAVIFLQVSILLSSISALTKKKFVWIISLFIAVIGIIYFFDGFFLIF